MPGMTIALATSLNISSLPGPGRIYGKIVPLPVREFQLNIGSCDLRGKNMTGGKERDNKSRKGCMRR
jgi:hypothetical protein